MALISSTQVHYARSSPLRVFLLSCLVGCMTDGDAAVLELRTDLVGGQEFVGIRVEARSEAMEVHRVEVTVRGPLDTDYRVVVPLEPGAAEVSASFIAPDGSTLMARDVVAAVHGATELAMFFTRDCLGVVCEEEGSTCVRGTCRACDPESTEGCEGFCVADEECESPLECHAASCREGHCFYTPDDALCLDADTVCAPGVGCVMEAPDAT